MVDISKRLKKLRESRGMTQEELGRAIGGRKQTIWRLEDGNNPTAQQLVDIATYFNCSVDYLLERVAQPNEILSARTFTPEEQRLWDAIINRSYSDVLAVISKAMRESDRANGGAA